MFRLTVKRQRILGRAGKAEAVQLNRQTDSHLSLLPSKNKKTHAFVPFTKQSLAILQVSDIQILALTSFVPPEVKMFSILQNKSKVKIFKVRLLSPKALLAVAGDVRCAP